MLLPRINRSAGFTLIELLVVITIIGILATMVTTVFSSAQKRSRDSQRKFDVKNLQASLEQYYSQQTPVQRYPAGNFTAMTNELRSQNFLKVIPADPVPSSTTPYFYVGLNKTGGDCSSTPATCQNYSLCVKLENTNDKEVSPPGPYVCTNNTYNFGVGAP